MEKKICKCCGEDVSNYLAFEFKAEDGEIDVSDYFTYQFKAKDGEVILVCDSCYQDCGMLTQLYDIWVELIIIDKKEYFMIK